ncbi:MAG: hypothetical protein RLZ18_55 [Actinomycetota bacterium]|jgi:carbon starvation protein CstA
MNCAEASSILSAPVSSAESRAEAQRHIAECGVCSPSTSINDILAAVRRNSTGRSITRIALAVVGLIELSLALPWLMGVNSWWVTDHHADASHLTRDGMLALVIATCALISASSRRYAFFCVVPAALAVVVQVMSGFYDDAHHRISSLFETIHIFHVVVFVLMLLELRAERSRQ